MYVHYDDQKYLRFKFVTSEGTILRRQKNASNPTYFIKNHKIFRNVIAAEIMMINND